MKETDTICAISTAHGKAGVALIRISGFEALDIVSSLFVAKNKTVSDFEPRKAYYGNIKKDDEIIDDVILTYFKSPNSYTGEDVVEISCHGGLYVTQSILETLLSSGARLAYPGEFTKRAYVNGKLTLTKAEAVGMLIDAQNSSQLKLANNLSKGTLSKKIESIREKLLTLLASSYVVVDYPDEDLPDVEREDMKKSIEDIKNELLSLKTSYKASKAISDGIKTVIIGKPNVGKSSLYNALSESDLAIVTDIAGTTRDVIENTISIGGATLRIADTAGIHKTEDVVEKIGVGKAYSKIDDAELIIAVFDNSVKESDEDYDIIDSLKGKSYVIPVINKTDDHSLLSSSFVEKIKENFGECIRISAKSGHGVDQLRDHINKLYMLDKIDISNSPLIVNARQLASINLALDKVEYAYDIFKSGQTPDIICFALENALSEIDMIDAPFASEEIVNQIFSRFCVGK